ncbi:hypothetical protein PAHAL_1G271200 [Panicum hallii]|jgi:hypothetical protein|uniref:C2H2-type domain-containing protein n=1 Tax=Panicum hallii TaxID=206008 RepID=A0A2T8KWH8_9POAL|nr:hypothetical protein PAHAL_1G271200 [Panicum hallii]
MDMQMDKVEFNSNLSLQQSYPPKLPTIFSCSYCRQKFQSAHALCGHQNAHKLQHSLGKRNREAFLAVRQGKDENAGMEGSSALSAEAGSNVPRGKKQRDEVCQVLQGSGGSTSSSTMIQKFLQQEVFFLLIRETCSPFYLSVKQKQCSSAVFCFSRNASVAPLNHLFQKF